MALINLNGILGNNTIADLLGGLTGTGGGQTNVISLDLTALNSLLSGGLDYTWQLAGGAEQTQGGTPAYNVRFSLSVAF